MESRIVPFLLSALALFGCITTGFNAVDVAKKSGQVQAFLAVHPGSNISVVLLSSDQTRLILPQYPACASIAPQKTYYVTFQDQSQSAEAFVSASRQTLLCAVIHNTNASPTATPKPSVPNSPIPPTALCSGGSYDCPDGSTCSSSSGGFVCTPPDATWVTCSPGQVCPAGDSCRPYLSRRPCGPNIACPLYLCVPSTSTTPTPSPSASPKISALDDCFPAPAAGSSGTVSHSMNAGTTVRFNPDINALTAAEQLGAVCSNGQLVDSNGKPILYYTAPCFGAQPPQETLQRIAAILNQLKQTYTIVNVEWKYACE